MRTRPQWVNVYDVYVMYVYLYFYEMLIITVFIVLTFCDTEKHMKHE